MQGCALAKNLNTTFPSSESRSKGILDLIHSYVFGPMSLVSVNGASYHMAFIDNFSRKTWIYFMKTKDEALGRFQEFKAQVANLTGVTAQTSNPSYSKRGGLMSNVITT